MLICNVYLMLAHTQTHIYTNMKRNAFQCFLHISFTHSWKSVLSACGSIFQCWTTAPLPGVLQSLPDRLKHLLEFLWGFFLYINTVRHGKLPSRLFKYLLNLVEKYVENREKKHSYLCLTISLWNHTRLPNPLPPRPSPSR